MHGTFCGSNFAQHHEIYEHFYHTKVNRYIRYMESDLTGLCLINWAEAKTNSTRELIKSTLSSAITDIIVAVDFTMLGEHIPYTIAGNF